MKIRTGFVSNSSSASFVIRSDKVNSEQIKLIESYHNFITDRWTITIDEDYILGKTSMNNDCQMFEFLTYKVGIPNKYVKMFHMC